MAFLSDATRGKSSYERLTDRVEPEDLGVVRGSGRTVTSRGRNGHELALPVGGEREAGADILSGQVREVLQDLLLRHPRGEIFQDVRHRDPQSPNAGLAETLSGLDGDPGAPVHAVKVRPP